MTNLIKAELTLNLSVKVKQANDAIDAELAERLNGVLNGRQLSLISDIVYNELARQFERCKVDLLGEVE